MRQPLHSSLLLLFLCAALTLTVLSFQVPLWGICLGLMCACLAFPRIWHPCLVLGAFLLLCLCWASGRNTLHLGLPAWQVSSIVGVLDDDSALTEAGSQFVRLHLSLCMDPYGTAVTSSGSAQTLIPCGRMIPAGSAIQLWGRWKEDGFFQCSDWQVLSLGTLGWTRFRWALWLEDMLGKAALRPSARTLARMLLLGRNDSRSFPLKELALQSGCSHVLALSGMHLGAVSMGVVFVCTKIFSSVIGSLCGAISSCCFVLLVGPKPSLVRALFFHVSLLLFRGRADRASVSLMASLILQLLLAPYHLSSLGFPLSYLACAALLLAPACTHGMHPFLAMEASGALVVLATLSVTVSAMGQANFGALVVSFPASLLVLAAWHLSFLALCRMPGAGWLLEKVTKLLFSLLSACASLSFLSIAPSHVPQAVSLLLTALFLLGYAVRHLRRARSRRYELEIRVRFPSGDQDGPESAGHGHVQALRAELPDFHVHSREDR